MKILAIDDNKDNLTTLKAIVQDILPACTLLTALNGPRGLELALAEDPDVILLDIVMPGMDGHEVCRRLKADVQLRSIPVVFLTALRTDRESRIKALDAGAEAFLAKPLDEQELVAAVRSMARLKAANCRQRSENERLIVLVAERTRALELELARRQEAEEKYHHLFHEMIDAFALHEIICDEAGKPIDYRFLDVNPAFERMTGLTANDVIGRTVMDVMPRTERRWIENYAHVALTGEPVSFEHYAIEIEKYFAVAAFRPSPNQFACTFIDITQRKLAEKALQQAQAILQAAMDQSTAGIAIADAPSGELRYVNDAGLLIRGETRETVVNGIGINKYVSSWNILDLDGRPLETDEVPLTRAVRFGETCCREFIIRRMEDDDRVVRANAAPIRDESGKVVAGIVVFLDITESRRAAMEKDVLQTQLAQAQKMESVGRLAGGVAHDFNNMLMGIMGYAQLCLDKVSPDHPIRGWLDEIDKAAENSAKLTHQLLAFARKQIIAPTVLDFNDAISSMLKLLNRLIGEDITMKFMAAAGTWPVKMDPVQINQILVNLVVNARDAIGGVGSITIETSNATFDEAYCAGNAGSVPGDYALLTVTDTGCGMDRETMKNIFEPFFTTKGVGEGTGLGLATVYGIVKQNNGYITVYSEPGKGTTFKIYLPRHVLAETVQAAVAATPAKSPRGAEIVLLVEDEKSIRLTTHIFLEDLGYTVLVAEDPKKALRLVAEHPGEIHLLITDVIMPGMSGRDLANRLAEHRPAIKRLFMSGFTADVIAHRGVLDDGVNFLSKPFGRDALARKVREVLEGGVKSPKPIPSISGEA